MLTDLSLRSGEESELNAVISASHTRQCMFVAKAVQQSLLVITDSPTKRQRTAAAHRCCSARR